MVPCPAGTTAGATATATSATGATGAATAAATTTATATAAAATTAGAGQPVHQDAPGTIPARARASEFGARRCLASRSVQRISPISPRRRGDKQADRVDAGTNLARAESKERVGAKRAGLAVTAHASTHATDRAAVGRDRRDAIELLAGCSHDGWQGRRSRPNWAQRGAEGVEGEERWHVAGESGR